MTWFIMIYYVPFSWYDSSWIKGDYSHDLIHHELLGTVLGYSLSPWRSDCEWPCHTRWAHEEWILSLLRRHSASQKGCDGSLEDCARQLHAIMNVWIPKGLLSFQFCLRLLQFFQSCKWTSGMLAIKKKVSWSLQTWLKLMTSTGWQLMKQESLLWFCVHWWLIPPMLMCKNMVMQHFRTWLLMTRTTMWWLLQQEVSLKFCLIMIHYYHDDHFIALVIVPIIRFGYNLILTLTRQWRCPSSWKDLIDEHLGKNQKWEIIILSLCVYATTTSHDDIFIELPIVPRMRYRYNLILYESQPIEMSNILERSYGCQGMVYPAASSSLETCHFNFVCRFYNMNDELALSMALGYYLFFILFQIYGTVYYYEKM